MSKKIHFLLFFFLCLASIPLVAQNIEVKGVVTEATTNEPLPGVTVKVKGKDTAQLQIWTVNIPLKPIKAIYWYSLQ